MGDNSLGTARVGRFKIEGDRQGHSHYQPDAGSENGAAPEEDAGSENCA